MELRLSLQKTYLNCWCRSGNSLEIVDVGVNKVMKYSTLAAIIFANLIPIWGILNWGWDLGAILFLYWLESIIVGVFSLVRMWIARP